MDGQETEALPQLEPYYLKLRPRSRVLNLPPHIPPQLEALGRVTITGRHDPHPALSPIATLPAREALEPDSVFTLSRAPSHSLCSNRDTSYYNFMPSGSSTPSEGPAPSGPNPRLPVPDSPKHTTAANDTTDKPSSQQRKESPGREPRQERERERESSPEEGEEDESYEDEREEGEEPEPEDGGEQPPLPPEAPPGNDGIDDGWQPVWDETYQAYYFYNSLTNETTWTNPRVPTAKPALAGDPPLPLEDEPDPNLTYNPAIHGDYDPSAPYAQQPAAVAPGDEYVARGAFNRFTGKFQPATSRRVPETYNDENKTRRQMEFYFDVDAAASTHDGRSLKAERQTRKLSRKEVKQFQEKRKARKEEKRKAWLRD